MALFVVSCSNGQNTKKTKTTDYKSFEDAPVIDRYRIEAAYQIHKNWVGPAPSKAIDPKYVTMIVFKIMPDGIIQDIQFVKRSGDDALDKAAIEAITRTSPFKPHPKELSETYVEMGIRFSSEGVK